MKPFGFRLLLAEAGLLALRSWGRAWTVIEQIDDYRDLEAAPPPALYVTLNLVWAVTFTVFTGAMWRRQAWAWRWLWTLLLAYSLSELAVFGIFAQTDYDQGRGLFVVLATAAGLFVNYWLLHRRRFRAAFLDTGEV